MSSPCTKTSVIRVIFGAGGVAVQVDAARNAASVFLGSAPRSALTWFAVNRSKLKPAREQRDELQPGHRRGGHQMGEDVVDIPPLAQRPRRPLIRRQVRQVTCQGLPFSVHDRPDVRHPNPPSWLGRGWIATRRYW